MQQMQQMQAQQSLTEQAGQFANAPMMDPVKNPDAIEQAQNITGALSAQVANNTQPPQE